MRNFAYILGLFFLWYSSGNAAEISIREILQQNLKKHNLPAIAGAIIDDNEILALDAVGLRQLGGHVEVTPQDHFHLGSCTKAMTATLAAKLVEYGRVEWQTTLQDVFPQQTVHTELGPITLDQLLVNRSGLLGKLTDKPFWPQMWDIVNPEWGRAALFRNIMNIPLQSNPGTEYLYSNTGYALAGHMLETIMEQPWEVLMKTHLFDPLGMSSCGFGPPAFPGHLGAPWGHREVQGLAEPVFPDRFGDNPGAIGPAGTVHCSMGDWSKFIMAHLNGAQNKTSGYLSTSLFKKLHTPWPGKPSYAMGWGVTELNEQKMRLLSHAGSNSFFYANVMILPEMNFAVLTAMNQGGSRATRAAEEVLSQLIEILVVYRRNKQNTLSP